MMLATQILVVLGLGLMGYAIYGVFTSGQAPAHSKLKIQDPPVTAEDPGKEQKIQRLQSQIAKLETQLEESKVSSGAEKSELGALKEKEAQFAVELKRREEWVAKAEAELAKIKTENSELNNKFTAKEKELEEEFTKNVNLTREIREIKAALETKEMACRLKEDELQTQKHQIEAQLKTIHDHVTVIAEFNRKEKISEWVPKSEFNQLNEEYTKLEKELESNQERLKSFAAEIAHLRPAVEKKAQVTEEAQLPPAAPEEIEPEKPAAEATKDLNTVPAEAKPEEASPAGENMIVEDPSLLPEPVAPEEVKLEDVKPEEVNSAEESAAVEGTNPLPEPAVPEEIEPEKPAAEENQAVEETQALEAAPEEVKPEEPKPAEASTVVEEDKVMEEVKLEDVKPEEAGPAKESKAGPEVPPEEDDPGEKTKEAPEQK